MKKSFQIVLLALILSLLLTGCMDANEQFIQGQWYWDNPHFFGLEVRCHIQVRRQAMEIEGIEPSLATSSA